MRLVSKRHIIAATCGLLALAASPVLACTIDSVPSATALGRVAITYQVDPASINPATYAPFIFPGSFGVGWSIRFGERSTGLQLTPSQLRDRWRWTFGDGTTAWGHTVMHSYRKPGTYVITVVTDVRSAAVFFPFDRVLVQVLAPARILPVEAKNLLYGSRFDSFAAPLGGLIPLQRVLAHGLTPIAGEILGQVVSGAWASIKDYWRYTRGRLPPAYARVDALLRQESTALAAQNQRQALAVANALLKAWGQANSGQRSKA